MTHQIIVPPPAAASEDEVPGALRAKECPDERDADEKDRAEEHDEGQYRQPLFPDGTRHLRPPPP